MIVKRRFRILLDLYWADWAVEQIDGVRGGSRHRCYPGQSSVSGSDGAGGAWFHFGLGQTGSDHPGYICAATTFYRPASLIVDLALDTDGRGEFEYVSRRPGWPPGASSEGKKPAVAEGMNEPAFDYYVLDPNGGGMVRYTWCTPDFVLGHEHGPGAWARRLVGHQQPESLGGRDLRRPSDGADFRAIAATGERQPLQCQLVAAASRSADRTTPQAAMPEASGVWFDKSLPRTEKKGWVFAEAPRAFAAVRVLSGGTSWEADGPSPTPWLTCKDEFSPIIIEVAGKSDLPTLDAFQAAVIANPLAFASNRVDYESALHDTRFTLFADYSQPPQVNGKPVDYRPPKVYDCPYIQSDFGDGRVVIKKGQEELVLDFNAAQ